jgi:hypothetical protein
MYQRFGAQLQANVLMKDMLGVVEADCIEPTHNKQVWLHPPLTLRRTLHSSGHSPIEPRTRAVTWLNIRRILLPGLPICSLTT